MKTKAQTTRKLRGAWRLAEVRFAIEEAKTSQDDHKLTQVAKEVGNLGFTSIATALLAQTQLVSKCERVPTCSAAFSAGLARNPEYFPCFACDSERKATRHKSRQKKSQVRFQSKYPRSLYKDGIDPLLDALWDLPWAPNNSGGLVLKKHWRHLRGKLSDPNKPRYWQIYRGRTITKELLPDYLRILNKEAAEAESDTKVIKAENERVVGILYAFLFRLLARST